MNRFEDHRMSFDSSSGDEYQGFDLSEDEETARGPLILALALGVLIVFAAVVWNTYRQGVRAPGDVPLIRADAGPYKTPGATADEGDGAGAASVNGPGATFYREFEPDGGDSGLRLGRSGLQVSERERSEAAADALQGGPAIDLTTGLDGMGAGQAGDGDAGAGPREDQLRALADLANAPLAGDAPEVAPTATTPAAPARPPAQLPPPSTKPALRSGSPAPSADTGSAGADAGPAPASPPVAGHAANTAVTVVDTSPEGAFLVQLAAYRSEEAADAGWEQFTLRHGALFRQVEKRVQRADLEAKGVFYRLRAGAFETRAGATTFCDRLKREGLDCIVVGG